MPASLVSWMRDAGIMVMSTLKQLQNGGLKGSTSLKLSEHLTSFPEEIFELADTLEILDLSRNRLTSLPADFGRLKKLRILFCSENLFTAFPEVLADCPLLDIVGFKANIIDTVPARSLNSNLRWLILTDNRIKELPAEIGACSRMQKLMLAGNRLESLPRHLAQCRNLSLLRISANRINELPAWLLSMPKLSWLAFSGNVFSGEYAVATVPIISWSDLEIKSLLGEGASGIIYKADWNRGALTNEVAVKIFKGSVTSDGLPEDELNTSIAAGNHLGLIPIIGEIKNHPDDRSGLVMELIPGDFYNLGLPPTFESCTRDVLKSGTKLTEQSVIKIARTIASAAAYLHSKGIMHCDLYAHNILVDDHGNALLGDFGAASFYDLTDLGRALALQRLEVSAYGYLLEDLLGICEHAGESNRLKKMAGLKDMCLCDDVLSRPSFDYLEKELNLL
jgi:hypothetical protein